MNYILQKDLLFGGGRSRVIKKGMPFLPQESRCYTSGCYLAKDDGFVAISKEFVENNPDWFAPAETPATEKTMRNYILQHDIITPGYENHVIKAGTVIRETFATTGNGNVIFRSDNGDIFTDTYVIDNPLWFLPEITPEGITGTGETSTRNTDSECHKAEKFCALIKEQKLQSTIDALQENLRLLTMKYLHLSNLIGGAEKEDKCGCFTSRDPGGQTKFYCEKHKPKVEEPEAVRFAKWMRSIYYLSPDQWHYYKIGEQNPVKINTEELYKKFKEQK